MTNRLTPRGGVLLQKLSDPTDKIFSARNATLSFITLITTYCYSLLSWTRRIQPTPSHSSSSISIVNFSPIYGLISQVEPISSCCMRFLTFTLAIRPIKVILFDFIILMKQSIAYIDGITIHAWSTYRLIRISFISPLFRLCSYPFTQNVKQNNGKSFGS